MTATHLSSTALNAIIIGMPRSGTSLTAGLFARKNYYVASDTSRELRPGDQFNPFGYWEAEPLTNHNAAILGMAGFSFHNTWLFDRVSRDIARRIAELQPTMEHRDYVKAFAQHRPWVWKDPRLCYTLSYWWPLMDPLTTRVVVVRRDSAAILHSFQRLNWRSKSATDQTDVLRRIDDHVAAATRTIDALRIPYLEINYSDYFSSPALVARKLSETFHIALGTEDLNALRELDHNSWRGRLIDNVAAVARILPPGVKRTIKRIASRAGLKVSPRATHHRP